MGMNEAKVFIAFSEWGENFLSRETFAQFLFILTGDGISILTLSRGAFTENGDPCANIL